MELLASVFNLNIEICAFIAPGWLGEINFTSFSWGAQWIRFAIFLQMQNLFVVVIVVAPDPSAQRL